MLPSPNHGDRRGRAIDCVILHYTGMATGEAALSRLRDPVAEVSAHYLVWEDGRVDQLVAEADRAWHAGRAVWRGERDINAVSVGIEIVNGGHDHGLPPYPPAQIAGVVALVGDVCGRNAISPRRVLGHSDIAPDRKNDPGELFPWHLLSEAGVAAGPVVPRGVDDAPAAPPIGQALASIGYDPPADGDDAALAATLRAFQRRWRPSRVDGIADGETRALVRAVAATTAS